MKTIFKEITAQLDTVLALRWADEQKGQMNFERPPVAFPAALVTLAVPQVKAITDTVSHAKLQVQVMLCFDFMGDTSNQTPQESRDKSLEYYDAVEEVKAALKGFEGSNFNALEWVSGPVPIHRADAYKTVALTFSSAFNDED